VSAATQCWPAAIARHTGLVNSLTEAQQRGWSVYPLPALCAFLGRLERRYPGMRIKCLRPTAIVAGKCSVLRFWWGSDDILRSQFLAPEALPQGRKRICISENPLYARAEWRDIVRVSKSLGWLEVTLRVPDWADANHPLAFFRPSSVREGSARPLLRLVVDNTRGAP
jgi:hypothetical protein